MTTPYEELDFAGKAVYHTRKFEEFQGIAMTLERIAGDRAADDQMAAYLLSHDEEFKFPYKQAIGNRNAHQQQAIMYGILALLQRSYK